MTPIIETMRSLLTDGRPAPTWGHAPWAAGIYLSYTLALRIYRRRAPLPVAA